LDFKIGDLVQSDAAFSGIGKVISLDEVTSFATVGFFESPVKNASRALEVNLDDLTGAKLFDEANVFLEDPESGVWRRARYGSKHPNGKHLVLFKRDESALVDFADIYFPNFGDSIGPDPLEFLEARCADTPFLYRTKGCM
jgi:ATP-dependent helicase HepA